MKNLLITSLLLLSVAATGPITNFNDMLPEVPAPKAPIVQRIKNKQLAAALQAEAAAIVAAPKYLAWDHPDAVNPYTRFEVWSNTQLSKDGWQLFTNTRYHTVSLPLDYMRSKKQEFFIVRAAYYGQQTDGSVNWDDVVYSDWSHK